MLQVWLAFFSYWIRGGFVPTVELEYSLTPDANGTHTVDGCITTDKPTQGFKCLEISSDPAWVYRTRFYESRRAGSESP